MFYSFEKSISRFKTSGTFHWEFSISGTTLKHKNVTNILNQKKFQTFSLTNRHIHFRVELTHKRSHFDL